MDQKAEENKKEAEKPKPKPKDEGPSIFVVKMKEELMKMTMGEQLKYNR